MATTLADSAVSVLTWSWEVVVADWLLHKYSQTTEADHPYQAGGDHPSGYFVN